MRRETYLKYRAMLEERYREKIQNRRALGHGGDYVMISTICTGMRNVPLFLNIYLLDRGMCHKYLQLKENPVRIEGTHAHSVHLLFRRSAVDGDYDFYDWAVQEGREGMVSARARKPEPRKGKKKK